MKHTDPIKLALLLLLFLFVAGANAQAPANGLAAWYPMNGDGGDSSGNGNHAVLYNSVVAGPNRFSMPAKALTFNGTSTYMQAPAATSINTATFNNICISTWFKVTSGTANNTDRLIIMCQDPSNKNYTLEYNATTNKVIFINYSSPSTIISITSSTTLTINTWYHLALRIDSVNNTQMFINNQVVASSTITVVKPVSPFISIGRHPIVSGTWNFLGNIDDVRIYNRYITNAEIASIYYDGISGLVAWYPMSGNAGDSSGYNNHGTVYGGMTPTTGRSGLANTAYYFDGINDYIQVPRNLSIEPQNQLTLAAWIAPEFPTAGWRTIISKRWATASDPYDSYLLSTNPTYANKWQFAVSTGVPGSLTFEAAHNFYPAQQWLFLTATLQGGAMKLYINGALDSTRSFVGSLAYSTMDLYLGWGVSGPNEYYKGKVDDIKIYNRALSSIEIQQLYSDSYKTTYYSKSSGDLNVLSTWGTNTDGSGTSPLSFDSSNTRYYAVNNLSPVLGGNWTINGTNTLVVFGDGTSSYNLTVPGENMIICDSAVINSNITITVQGTLNTSKVFGADNSTIQYFGSGPQNLAGGSFYNVICTAASKSLLGNLAARNALTMTTSLNCASYILTIGSSATQLGTLTRTNGIITGKVARWFDANTASSVLFPVGTSGIFRPIYIDQTTPPTAAGTLMAEFVQGNPGQTGLPYYDGTIVSDPVFIDRVSTDGYWRLTQGNGLSGGAYTVTAVPASFYGVSDYTKLRLVKRTLSGSWTIPGNSMPPTGSNALPYVVRTGQTGSSEIGIGSDQSQNSLPVSWLDFDVIKVRDAHVLSWSTAQEINTSYFEAQRSINGKDWDVLSKTKAAGNSAKKLNYTYSDFSFDPAFAHLYYRIREVDMDGKFEYSAIADLTNDEAGQELFSVFPNPANARIEVMMAKPAQITVIAADGKLMFRGFETSIDVQQWPRGLYLIRVGNTYQKISLIE